MNDLYTLNGLENNNILIDPILIHIWILANLYRPYDKDDLKTIAPLKSPISNVELYDYLYKINFTDDKTKNTNISIRLKNIFFRAVNVCYNNRTTFSANIINKTKKALQNKELINFIIDNGFYINPDSNIKNAKRYKNFSSSAKLREFLENLENLDNFTEIYYYNDVELSELVNDITGKDEIVKKIIGDFGMENNTDGEINGENNRFKYLFSIEYLEISNVCKLNEVYNPVTGLCSKRPPKFEKIEVKKDEDNVDSIDEQLKIPQMKYFITLFIQGVFVIIIGYIIYFFYNFFGETFFASINWITESYNSYNDERKIGNLEKHIAATTDELNSDEYTKSKKINKIKEDRLQRHIDFLKQKLNILTTYEKEQGITRRQKERKKENQENQENQENDE